MRVRIIVAIVVSAVLAFGWGALAWSTGLYEGWAFRSLPQGDGLALEQARSQRERGPHIMVLVRHQPVPAAGDLTLVKGFALELFVCAILAGVMAIAAKWGMPVQDRLAIAFAFAAFAMCSTPAVQWNFWHLPDTFGLATAADAFVTWLVAGVTCALIIRPLKRRQKAA
jgi:hypothetical protein